MELATIEPLKLTAGDTWRWKKSLADFPATAWVLSYRVVGQGKAETLVAAASGADHLLTVLAAASAAWPAGQYTWTAWVSDGTDRHTVGSGALEILPDPAQAAAQDVRSHVKKTLDAIEAVIEKRASRDQQSYTIAGRSLARTPLPELLAMRDKYAGLWKREQAAAKLARGERTGRTVRVRL